MSFQFRLKSSWDFPKLDHVSHDFSQNVSGCGPRLGELVFDHITVPTPIFMPVGTGGSVKSLTTQDVWDMGYKLILGNTYHLNLRPGLDVVKSMGGLHSFIKWPGALLSDSGGFQVMSLAKIRTLSDAGVTFANHRDGGAMNLTPENVVHIQNALGTDIQMVLDECTPLPCTPDQAAQSLQRTLLWARRARQEKLSAGIPYAQFGIVQGGLFPQLRRQCAQELIEMGFEGYALGGLSVGETKQQMRDIVKSTLPFLPKNAPRYLMGVGTPDDLFDAIVLGVDMMDCVLPTRNARNGTLFVRTKVSPNGKLSIKNARFKTDGEPIDPQCSCYTCTHHSRAYVRHLFATKELTVYRLLSLHNLQFMHDLVGALQKSMGVAKDQGWTLQQLSRDLDILYKEFVSLL